MTDEEFDCVQSWISSCAADALYDLCAGFTLSRLRRVKGGLAWSEIIENEEVQFEAVIYEGTDSHLHVGVTATLSTLNGDILDLSATVDDIFQ